jgi:hypothetical protein
VGIGNGGTGSVRGYNGRLTIRCPGEGSDYEQVDISLPDIEVTPAKMRPGATDQIYVATAWNSAGVGKSPKHAIAELLQSLIKSP